AIAPWPGGQEDDPLAVRREQRCAGIRLALFERPGFLALAVHQPQRLPLPFGLGVDPAAYVGHTLAVRRQPRGLRVIEAVEVLDGQELLRLWRVRVGNDE